jgi:hypothetical protein
MGRTLRLVGRLGAKMLPQCSRQGSERVKCKHVGARAVVHTAQLNGKLKNL